MTALANYSQHWSANKQYSSSQDMIQNYAAAIESFKNAKKHGFWRRLRAWLSGRPVKLQHYATAVHLADKRAPSGVQSIALDQIIGSEGRSHDFDDQFWPITEHSRNRWLSVAVAMGTGKPLPPVQLIQTSDGYVVRDGHHRLSVARAFGQAVIEAEVI